MLHCINLDYFNRLMLRHINLDYFMSIIDIVMKSFQDVSIGMLIFLIVCVLVELYSIYHNNDDDELEFIHAKDHDTIISKAELKKILKQQNNKKKSRIKFDEFLQTTKSGVLKGCIMGLVTGGVGGALVYGTVLGITSPLVASIEHMI